MQHESIGYRQSDFAYRPKLERSSDVYRGSLLPKFQANSPYFWQRYAGNSGMQMPLSQPTGLPSIVQDVLQSTGQPLDTATRVFMEEFFRQDFRQVRIHTDDLAAKSARSINALAYTVGKDISFASEQYALNTSAGIKLLTHELTHVIQQRELTRSRPLLQRQIDQRQREEEQPNWSRDVSTTEHEVLGELKAVETSFTKAYQLLPPQVKANLWLMNLGAGFGAGLITGLSAWVNPQDIIDLSQGIEKNEVDFLEGELIGVVKGVGEDIVSNLTIVQDLIMLLLALSPMGITYLATCEGMEWVKDPRGRFAFYKKIAESLHSFEECLRNDPSALLMEGRELGYFVGDMAGEYAVKMVVNEPNYKNKGIAIGRIVGIIATEIALLFFGATEVKAIGKGISAAGSKAASVLKNTRFGKNVVAVLEKPLSLPGKLAHVGNVQEKLTEGVQIERAVLSTGSEKAAIAQESLAATTRGEGELTRSIALPEKTVPAKLVTNIPAAGQMGFTYENLINEFVELFKRPGISKEDFFVHNTLKDFEEAFRRANGEGVLPAGFYDYVSKKVHLPPSGGGDILTCIHELLHFAGHQGGVRDRVGLYLEEAITEWLARKKLGMKVARHPYNGHVAFVEYLSRTVVDSKIIERAYLHGDWDSFDAAIRRFIGNSGQTDEILRLLRKIGQNGENGEYLGRVIDMLFPASAEKISRPNALVISPSNPPTTTRYSLHSKEKLPESPALRPKKTGIKGIQEVLPGRVGEQIFTRKELISRSSPTKPKPSKGVVELRSYGRVGEHFHEIELSEILFDTRIYYDLEHKMPVRAEFIQRPILKDSPSLPERGTFLQNEFISAINQYFHNAYKKPIKGMPKKILRRHFDPNGKLITVKNVLNVSHQTKLAERGHVVPRELVKTAPGLTSLERIQATSEIDRMSNIAAMAGRGSTGINQGAWRRLEDLANTQAKKYGWIRVVIEVIF